MKPNQSIKTTVPFLLLAAAVSAAASTATFPGPYVSFGGELGPNFPSTGPLSSGSYTYSNTVTDQYSDSATVDASVGSSASDWGVMHLYTQSYASGLAIGDNVITGGRLEAGDTITPQSTTVAPGTLVPFVFTFTLHYSLTLSGVTSGTPQDLGGGGVYVGSEWGSCGFGSPAGGCTPFPDVSFSVVANGTTTGTTRTFQHTVDLPVGQSTYFVELLYDSNYLGVGTSTFDAGNTGWVNIASENPAVTFTTGSGQSYSGDPEVPEPGAPVLLGVGLIGFVLANRYRLERRTSGGDEQQQPR